MRISRGAAAATVAAGVVAAGLYARSLGTGVAGPEASEAVQMRTLSTPPDRVTGGDVLVEIVVPPDVADRPLTVTLDGRDVSHVFHGGTRPGVRMGLVSGLTNGRNRLEAAGEDLGTAGLDLTNYPTTGPVVSGPHLAPFVCQTAEFTLPDGSALGPALDADCSVRTTVQYVYMPVAGDEFKPMPSTSSLPADVATAATLHGRHVPFVVRVETGTLNRGIYQNAVLHDPTSEPEPSPFSAPIGWNRRLIAVHGSGCPSGWYRQGGVLGASPLTGANRLRLGEGYGIFTNTLNHPTNSCNPFLAGETTMMGKEHFNETFGVPEFTISLGGSGGAYTSLQVGDAFPGLFDGVIVTATFPDALSIALAGLDGRLLMRYFTVTNPGGLTEAQQVAIGGYHGLQALVDAANQAQRTDPVPGRTDGQGYSSARWHDAVPANLRYHPTTNPGGARPTIFDAARTIYGVDPETGYARRPYDNVGVQYGLGALNAGLISVDEFLDLNERIGGYDHDANYTPSRSVGNLLAIERAYQSGVTLGGGGGLASIPVFDAGRYNEARGYHYQWFHFAVRERMRKENGRADNHLMWRGAVPPEEAWAVLAAWVAAIKADAADGSPWDTMTRNRPTRAVDGCWIEESEGQPSQFVAETQTFTSRPDSVCNTKFPSYSFTRQVAGGPLAGNILKCTLKRIDPADYLVSLDAGQVARLRRAFPGGVCDWSQPGMQQVPVVPWASFGPAPERLLFTRKD